MKILPSWHLELAFEIKHTQVCTLRHNHYSWELSFCLFDPFEEMMGNIIWTWATHWVSQKPSLVALNLLLKEGALVKVGSPFSCRSKSWGWRKSIIEITHLRRQEISHPILIFLFKKIQAPKRPLIRVEEWIIGFGFIM